MLYGLLFCLAAGADTGELQLVAGDGTACGLSFLHHGGREDHIIQVHDLAALGADEMGVGGGGEIVPIQSIDHADGLDDALFLEHGNVPVDRSQTQIGELRLELLMNPFSSGMALGLADAVENGIALFTLFSDWLHKHLQINNNSYYNYNSSTGDGLCKEGILKIFIVYN